MKRAVLALALVAASAQSAEIGAGRSTRDLSLDLYARSGPVLVEWIDEGRQPCCPNRNRVLLLDAILDSPTVGGFSAYAMGGLADGEWSINSHLGFYSRQGLALVKRRCIRG